MHHLRNGMNIIGVDSQDLPLGLEVEQPPLKHMAT